MNNQECQQLKQFIQEEKDKWGITDYSFKIGKRKTQFGTIFYREKVITISVFHIRNSPLEHVKDTVLHEIAHAKAGAAAGHNQIWKNWAIKVGATPQRCADYQNVMPEGRFLLMCPSCCRDLKFAHRRSDLRRKYCRQCGETTAGKLMWIDLYGDD